ncbi:hypothetical protein COU19_01020 [Candidatus Kaiserbacteria bacterium CG10_big_fil_rev_8_21_14_0_10_56_12]|uniref:histidine kinase n=1 Tax=Candidatus Kaiserbacteria bacterium CG10_big_fil_rev_8_21_14_0_10_56_12 TaxID=1974611 RepID=A0A2H0UAC8_9BACT|nr:MAG: hypothetical protein COU19_01020 [Candidatus Kaiserbacteria bacterium CG10_big_fil_rev_8_21_14_0_10_56_12]
MSASLPTIAVLAVAVFNLILGAVVLTQDFDDRANRYFAVLSVSAVLWGVGTGFFFLVDPSRSTLFDLIARSNYFFGGVIPAAFLYFAFVFKREHSSPRWQTLAFFIPTLAFLVLDFGTSLIIVRPFVSAEGVRGFIYGPLQILFDLNVWASFLVAFVIFVKKYRHSSSNIRAQILYIAIGTYVTFGIAGIFNLMLPHFYGVFDYIWVGPVAIIFWVGTMAFAVARYRLFNVKVVSSELLVIALWLVLLLRIAFAQNDEDFLFSVGLFLAVLVLGVFVIRGVIRGARRRDLIEAQEAELSLMNSKQETLLHFISHEVKGYFAKSEAAFAGITEGDYGMVSPALQSMATNGLKDVRQAVHIVMNVLDASNLKKGAVSFKSGLFDLKKTLYEVVEELRPLANDKGLALSASDSVGSVCVVRGDELKMRKQVLVNIIENAIVYTPKGSVTVILEQSRGSACIRVRDTGVGIPKSDLSRLFTQGGYGAHARTVNVHATGYGLFIAKRVVETEGGSICIESDGENKGSLVTIILPLAV